MRRLGLALWALGMVAVLSLLLAPLEALMPAGFEMDPMAFRALALINPLVLTSLAVLIGCWAAPKLGLDAPLVRALLDRRGAGVVLRRQAGPALLGGIASAAVVLIYGALTADWFAGNAAVAAFEMPLVTKLLYGGVVEELMLRWGVMSLIAWIAWKLSRSRGAALWTAVLIAALLFALGHLPALYALVPEAPGGLVAPVIVANAVPGVICGLLFWRRGLEAAMVAHALAHLISTAALPLLQN